MCVWSPLRYLALRAACAYDQGMYIHTYIHTHTHTHPPHLAQPAVNRYRPWWCGLIYPVPRDFPY